MTLLALPTPLALVTAADARLAGIAVSSSRFHRVRSGVYVDAAAWRALAPWQRYEVRVAAFLRRHPDAVLSHESAAVAHGLPCFSETRDIHVFDPDRTASRRFGDVCVHTAADGRDITNLGGIRATSLSDTTLDLVRALPLGFGLAVADAALRTGADASDLIDRAAEQLTVRGRARVGWVLPRADRLAESPGESISRAGMEVGGFERPELQVVFTYEGFVDRVDFEFPSVGGIGESDGWGKYDLSDPAAAERHLRNEKRREDRLRRHHPRFARWDYGDSCRVTPMCRALVSSGIPQRYPGSPALAATLTRNPRART
ncbi:hypothetical protein [Microbacterium sp. bgisy189]|uniref:hypothetical protein n=1 Tax=Microbacterium sp. bgisy189 TaxID=3413798 RepID=UPI003EB9FFC6